MRELSQAEVRELLRQRCEAAGSQKAWADRTGLSRAYICDVLKGRRDPSEAIANHLGLVRKISYFPLKGDDVAA